MIVGAIDEIADIALDVQQVKWQIDDIDD